MLTTKENLIATVEEWLDFIKNQTSLQPQTIHSDGFREIIDSLEVLCAGRGISLSITAPYTPAANGKIEKAGRTFNDQGRATCIDVGLPTHMWPFAVESAIYVNNLLPTAANDFISPHEKLMVWFNTHERSVKPFIRHLRAFGGV